MGLSVQTSIRASGAYCRGYERAERSTNVGLPDDLPAEGTFYGRDFREGFAAGRNEQWWAAHRCAERGFPYVVKEVAR